MNQIYSFSDDYSEGCHPEILDALTGTNLEQQTAYGKDDYSEEARSLIASACGDSSLPVHLVSGGTLANLIIIAAALRPHEAVISASTGHIATREAGAIEATGHKIITVESADGRLDPEGIQQALAANAQFPHMAKPRMVYISNATEFGTVYGKSELAALSNFCQANDLLLMIDGARIGVALASRRSEGASLADIADLADIFWIGGTKAGALLGEAIVIPNPDLARDFAFHLKQRGALLAKGRVLGLQFRTLFSDDLFERSSLDANTRAQNLAAGLAHSGFTLAAQPESNQVFVEMKNTAIASLQESFSFYVWEPLPDEKSVIRLVTSWSTRPEEIERFVKIAESLG